VATVHLPAHFIKACLLRADHDPEKALAFAVEWVEDNWSVERIDRLAQIVVNRDQKGVAHAIKSR
jgi:hypothetical protein